MAARRGKSQAKRNSSNGTPGWVWLVAGAAIAAVVFLAAPGLFKKDGDGFLRVGPRPNPDAQPAPVADADVDAPAELPRPTTGKPATGKADGTQPTQYDFYTLLPGKEVQMSDAELAASARAEEAARARAALELQQSAAGLSTQPSALALLIPRAMFEGYIRPAIAEWQAEHIEDDAGLGIDRVRGHALHGPPAQGDLAAHRRHAGEQAEVGGVEAHAPGFAFQVVISGILDQFHTLPEPLCKGIPSYFE